MLNRLIRFSAANKMVVGLFILVLIILGIRDLMKLPIDAVPDITNNQVVIITPAPSLGAPDVERFITAPVEQVTRNIPGIIEQRSFSRFGLSLVTIVFNDETDIYWARTQVNERLAQAREQIPQGMGTPELGPVTTGLGEIFQYVVRTKPGYEGKYDLTTLRTIQDWIVRRQLLGTEGVAEVSSFGGALKQYEVGVNTDRLKSFGLTISDVFRALNENNSNTGGAYIEKGPSVLFIRTEGLVGNLADIEHIVVSKSKSGIPVLVRDVATVKAGSAIRYGATAYNDKGEVAGAVVMMLKGENSGKVITSIKEKIKAIERSLPEGVIIEAFLDRTKMVDNAIGTVKQNLIEGALIVVFVLVLFLGNLRAGLIVASVIPLAMLFAVIMMNLFGVSGNLMSLGALDFGLLVDGAVIIVEAVMHRLSLSGRLGAAFLNRKEMDREVTHAAGKMMNAAVFGQVIILIVYLPILTLQGIEGKMFRPMAQTISFAIIGAFLLSITYVPMMSALCLSRKTGHKENLSDRVMKQLQRWYHAALSRSLKRPRIIVASAMVLFGLSVALMTTFGGEFIPKLAEGDFAVETRLLPGSSLTKTINATQQTAKVLLDNFHEVEKVVTKIGSGEIPTDPMPMEQADMMVILKDKKEWTNADSYDELAEKMSRKLEEVPGVSTGFQFPVQMRFNELMTGARQDVVCKIFGDNLDSLALYSTQLGTLIGKIDGARDLYVETVTGVPQVVIRYNREAIARYGANIADINNTVQAAYAGAVAGVVFEGDRRFDLAIRLDSTQKKDAAQIGNLMVGLPGGGQVPLDILASISSEDGPYQIQREDAQRRITVGFNVRGRDVQSIVNELTEKTKSLKLPPGYHITYGGQYENLQHATKRLSIALPVALMLIFLMLFFAFRKLRYCLLIFSAIPLSAIGGVFSMWMRGMPFSISAGVGFIALFGVAVLNGIVLVMEMNRKKDDAELSLKDVILLAAKERLRPVLMTAAVASLGFLPMAISNGPGAEVQRPLATVVIGGLVSATLLTLFVLPALYLLFEKRKNRIPMKQTLVILLLLLSGSAAFSQAPATGRTSLTEVLNSAYANAQTMQVSRLQEKYYLLQQQTARQIPKTQFSTELGNYNSFNFDSRFSVVQPLNAAGTYRSYKSVLQTWLASAQAETLLKKAELKKLVQQLYLDLQYLFAREKLLNRTDSIYKRYQQIAALRFEKGESNLLEKTALDHYAFQSRLQLDMNAGDIAMVQAELELLARLGKTVVPSETLSAEERVHDTALLRLHPELQYQKQLEARAAAETALEKTRLKPEWTIGYNNQSIIGWQAYKDQSERYFNAGSRFSSVTLGLSLPVFSKARKAAVEAAKANETLQEANTGKAALVLQTAMNNALRKKQKYAGVAAYYRRDGLKQSAIMISTAEQQYRAGQISYIEWGNLFSQAISIETQYLEALKEIQLAEIELDYLLNNDTTN
ncbi:CusA/CzcA family heavy metal efflux RND transporter [Sediminibacterium ginsengisoli]|uniref:Cobalt-zinc-cadmium resistance protein CzcA n=1 Tax=Sediminibacterium ginsengisoli TaxID=413434 RepID=A0A1T4KYQ1_9BACT|nr:CusA/CzcA family heavy metal efflux RND transporter [Sediminibacterium ginsengisoli]SJZ47556.1 cobalt-zinc-cadmium resistance protein CzcA [Sediminibacterium ginsengisoli]